MRLVSADWNFWPDGLDRADIWRLSASMGFSGMELGVYRADDELSGTATAAISVLARETGLGVDAVLFSMPPERWPEGGLGVAGPSARAVAELTETARRAADLGATVLGVWPGADAPADGDREGAWARTRDALGEVADVTGPLGLKLAVEYKPGQLIAGACDALRMVDDIGPGVGVLVDTAHAFAAGEDVAALPALLAERIAHVHLGDSNGDPDADLPPGAEHDFAPFLDGLGGSGYAGVLSFDLYGAVVGGAFTGAEASRQGVFHVRDALARAGR
ncbi:MAG: sugar phosphate isomerase/epimerase family protein [Acidimicrobiales bacterium]